MKKQHEFGLNNKFTNGAPYETGDENAPKPTPSPPPASQPTFRMRCPGTKKNPQWKDGGRFEGMTVIFKSCCPGTHL